MNLKPEYLIEIFEKFHDEEIEYKNNKFYIQTEEGTQQVTKGELAFNLFEYLLQENEEYEKFVEKRSPKAVYRDGTMPFKEQLRIAENCNINAFDLSVATEVEFHFGANHKSFETICNKIKECYLHTNTVSLDALASAFSHLVANEGLKKALKADKYLIIRLGAQDE